MKFKGILEFEYTLTPEEVAEIESLRGVGGDYPAEFYQDAENSLFTNDPHWFIRNRLYDTEVLAKAYFKANVLSRKHHETNKGKASDV